MKYLIDIQGATFDQCFKSTLVKEDVTYHPTISISCVDYDQDDKLDQALIESIASVEACKYYKKATEQHQSYGELARISDFKTGFTIGFQIGFKKLLSGKLKKYFDSETYLNSLQGPRL